MSFFDLTDQSYTYLTGKGNDMCTEIVKEEYFDFC